MTRAEIHQRHIDRLGAELVEAQKRLKFAQEWPIMTAYNEMVRRQFPAKIEKLVKRINEAFGREV